MPINKIYLIKNSILFTFYLQLNLSFLTKPNRENKKEYICSINDFLFFHLGLTQLFARY